MPLTIKEATADAAVKLVLNTFKGRKGFGAWWEGIDESDQEEILSEAAQKILRVLP